METEQKLNCIKGYKVFNKDWTCRGKQYTCPGEFEENGILEMCRHGMHFCTNLEDCFRYYHFNPLNHIAEVCSYGNVVTDDSIRMPLDCSKCCTDKLKIIREIPFSEAIDIIIKSLEYDIEFFSSSNCTFYSDSSWTWTGLDADITDFAITLYRKIQSNEDKMILFINSLNDSLSDTLDGNEIMIDMVPYSDFMSFYVGRNPDDYTITVRQDLSRFLTMLEKNEMTDIIYKYTNMFSKAYLQYLNQGYKFIKI